MNNCNIVNLPPGFFTTYLYITMKSIAKIFPYMGNFTIIKQIFSKYIENHYPDIIFELNMIKY